MREVKLSNPGEPSVVHIDYIDTKTLIIAKRDGGDSTAALIKEPDGWILRTAGGLGMTGHHETREANMEHSSMYGYKYYIVD